MIAVLYTQGFAVYNIAKRFQVSTSTIEWHLIKNGLYVKNRRPTQWNGIIPRKQITVIHRPLSKIVISIRSSSRPLPALPAHIQKIYDKMEQEDNEIIKKASTLTRKQFSQGITKPFNGPCPEISKHDDWRTRKAMYSFTL